MAMLQSIVLLLVIVCSIHRIDAYPSGAPKQLCTGPMIPHHGSHTVQPLTTSPITAFNTTLNTTGETIALSIQSNEPIKGVFIQARRMNGSEPIGTFLDIPEGMKIVQCPTGEAVTHSARNKWKQIQLTWKKPASIKTGEEIQFWSTIVVEFNRFWVVKST